MTTVYRLARHELRLLAGLALWLTRRTHGTAGGRAFGYARGQGATMPALAFVCLIETAGVAVMLRDQPVAHDVMLVLDGYTVLFVVALHAACAVRPHVLTPDALRVRYGAHVDLRIPLTAIAAVRRESRATHEPAEGTLDLAVGSRTTVTLELAEPVVHTNLLGRGRQVGVVRLYADDTDGLVRALTPR
ncbi:hypothetical protein [Streptomyces cyanogenus]|uniref:Integral membrane protein n=1 Tax=Streptomyces cyanogenus TaxID=80860 RepID=A0ABX7TP88_STRCY|nr:hypothetical protein [Streptomyces cyanogenus]QTD98211.1 hypothetical protein S1361_12690 [Streptomyces cyanogenus]